MSYWFYALTALAYAGDSTYHFPTITDKTDTIQNNQLRDQLSQVNLLVDL